MLLHHVIRMEHGTSGKGPFQHLDYNNLQGVAKLLNEHVMKLAESEGMNALPPPIIFDLCFADILELTSEFVCGVEYISQLQDWFFHLLPDFLVEGYKIYLYTLPKDKILFGESGKQVAFRKADALEVAVLYEG